MGRYKHLYVLATLYKSGLDRNVYHVGLLILRRIDIYICMESSEHNGVYIFSPICTNRLISRKWSFFIFSNLSHNFKNLVFETSLLLFSNRALSLTGIENKRAFFKRHHSQGASKVAFQTKLCLSIGTNYILYGTS